MSPYECCLPPGLICPEPFALTSNETYVIKYPDTVMDIVEPDLPLYSVIYPGPTLTTFPQQTIVGSTALFDVRNLLGSRGFNGFRGMCGSGTACNSFYDIGNFNPSFPHLSIPFCYRTCRRT